MQQELRETVKKLLRDKEVSLVIGWGRGSLPMTATPIFVKNESDANNLIFNLSCRNNLTTYLTKDRKKIIKDSKKVGIIVKGCDARSLMLCIIEKQFKRENLVIIGVPCEGVIERKKLLKMVEGKEILECQIVGDGIIVKGRDFNLSLLKQDVLSDSCLNCQYPDALEFDFFIGKPSKEVKTKDEFGVVDDFEKLSPDERWNYIKEEYSKCIRCYACRNVCPSCYCDICFVDQNDPQWIGKSPEFTDTLIFHLIRNLHVAGRCVDCGACVSACPMGIDLRILNKKVEKEIKRRFNYTAGLDMKEKPVMANYDENEKQDFIMG